MTKKISRLLTAFPLAPVLLAASYVLTLYHHNIGELTLKVLIQPLTAILAVLLPLSVIINRVLGDRTKGNIFLSGLTFMFFAFNDLTAKLTEPVYSRGPIYIPRYQLMALVYITGFTALYVYLKKSQKNLASINRFVIYLGLISVILPLFNIARYELFIRAKSPVQSQLKLPEISAVSAKNTQLPDIYYIVPDSYSAPVNFSKYFGYDNSQFVTFLESRGFFVAGGSTSNYPKTYLSLSSTLNMEYLDYLSVYKNSTDETLITPLIRENNVLKFLKSAGYKYYQIGSWWGPTHYSRLAEKNYNLDLQNFLGINAFNSIIIESSVLKLIIPKKFLEQIVSESVEDKRLRTIYQFETLKKITELPGPKFIFAHIIAPHGPNVFGRNCEFIEQQELWDKTDEAGYYNQVSCINKMLSETIDTIISKSPAPPVILLQSDEGAPFLANRLIPPDNWQTADRKLIKQKFPILSAYFLPGINPDDLLYPTITPVNSFRVIFNAYFGLNLPVLPDRNFVNLDMNHRYEFREVTDEVQN